jgi:ABC-2 type transport system permease protein
MILLAVALTTLVPVMILLAAWLGQTSWLSWAAVPAGIATGVSLAAYLGRRAVIRLESQQVRILTILADAAR